MRLSNLEEHILKILKNENIDFEREKSFSDLKRGLYRYDFYLPNYKGKEVLIEVDGIFHFKPITGKQRFIKQQNNDRRKNSYALANEIPLYRIPYWKIETINKSKDIFNLKYLVKDKWFNDNLQPP